MTLENGYETITENEELDYLVVNNKELPLLDSFKES